MLWQTDIPVVPEIYREANTHPICLKDRQRETAASAAHLLEVQNVVVVLVQQHEKYVENRVLYLPPSLENGVLVLQPDLRRIVVLFYLHRHFLNIINEFEYALIFCN